MNINPRIVVLSAVTLMTLVNSRPANAGYLNEFCGNTESESTLGAQISKNFAVLDRLTGASTPGDVFGTGLAGFDTLMTAGAGSAAFDTSARYLYLYQYVAGSGGTFSSYGVGNNGQPLGITSYGQWSLFLSDDDGIISTTNDFGVDGIAFSTSAPANIGVTSPSVASSGPVGSLVTGSISANATSISDSFSPALTAGQINRILGFTTNSPPQYLTAPSSSFGAGGTVPVPTPEPSSLAIISLGAISLMIYLRYRHRREHGSCSP